MMKLLTWFSFGDKVFAFIIGFYANNGLPNTSKKQTFIFLKKIGPPWVSAGLF